MLGARCASARLPVTPPEPTCSVDMDTEVPEGLFNDLMRLGRQVRKGGQHVLLEQSAKNGGVKLVHPEVARRIRHGSVGRIRGVA